jgi:hypothetical protein
MTNSPDRARGAAARAALWALGAGAVVVQLVVLYVPTAPGVPLFPGADKVVHVVVFALPVLLLLLAGAPPAPLLALFAAHAGVSEVVQAVVLPDRSGDPFDVVADLAGVVLAWALWRVLRGRASPSV